MHVKYVYILFIYLNQWSIGYPARLMVRLSYIVHVLKIGQNNLFFSMVTYSDQGRNIINKILTTLKYILKIFHNMNFTKNN